jgi:hypothetical protein
LAKENLRWGLGGFLLFLFEFFTRNEQGEIRISFLGKNPRLLKMLGPVFLREDGLALRCLRDGYGWYSVRNGYYGIGGLWPRISKEKNGGSIMQCVVRKRMFRNSADQ